MFGYALITSTGSAKSLVEHYMNNTLSAEECRLAAYYGRGAIETEHPVLTAARAVASGEMAYSDALDGLMLDWLRAGGDVDLIDAAQERIGDRLQVLAARIQEGLEDAPLATVRPDLHPTVARNLGVEADGILSRREINALILGLRADGDRVEGKVYAKARSLPPDKRTGKERSSEPIGSIDFTPTPHKSVSVAWGFARDPVERAKLLNCHLEAAREAMAHIEMQVGRARLGKGGEDGFEQGHIFWLEFTHHTSRPIKMSVVNGEAVFDQDMTVAADPDLHTHFLVHNSVHCDSGRIGSLDTAKLRGFIFEADALYHARLGDKLREAGFDAERDERTGSAKLRAIPEDACQHFSKRTNMGEAYAKIQAAKRGEVWDDLTPEQRSERIHNATQDRNQKSRGDKDGKANFADWEHQADQIGWQRPQSFLAYGPLMPERSAEVIRREAYEVALDVLEQRFEQRSVLTSWEVRAAAGQGLIHAGCPAGVGDIDGVVKIMAKEGVRLYGEQTALRWGLESDGRVTSVTTELHELHEQEFIGLATAAARDCSAALPKAAIDKAVRESGLDFSDAHGRKQLEMIHRLGGEGRLAAGVAAAGAGKTAALKPLRAAWEAAGRDVWGTSLASRQSDDLADAGIRQDRLWAFSVMLDKLKTGEITLTRNSVLALDETGLLGTRQGLELLRLQDKHGFQIVSLGDPAQIKSIEAGSIYDLLRRSLGDENMPAIATTKRQKSDREKAIVGLIRDGQPAEALAMKREDGTAEMVQGGDQAVIARVAKVYAEQLAATGQAPTISAPTNAEAHDIGSAVRLERRKLGQLGPDVRTMRATDGSRDYVLPLAVGDKVRLFESTRVRKSEHGRGGRIGRNGTIAEVLALDGHGITLRSDKTGTTGKVAWDDMMDKRGRVKLAYGDVSTVHTAQGSTSKNHILALPHGSRALKSGLGYSGLTRHEAESLIIVSRQHEYVDVVQSRPKNDVRRVTDEDCWANTAGNLLPTAEKDLASSMTARVSNLRTGTVRAFHAAMQPGTQRQAHGERASDAAEHVQRQRAGRSQGLGDAVREMGREVAERAHRAREAAERTMHQAREHARGVWQRTAEAGRPAPGHHAQREREQQQERGYEMER